MKKLGKVWAARLLALVLLLRVLPVSTLAADVSGVTMELEGEEVCLVIEGTAGNEYYQSYPLTLNYGNGKTAACTVILQVAGGQGSLATPWDVKMNETVSVTAGEGGAFRWECRIPVSFFGRYDFSVSVEGFTLESTDVPGLEDISKPAELQPNAKGKIVVDGALEDWSAIAPESSADSAVESWKLVRDTAGNVYFCFTGATVSEWDGQYNNQVITIGQNGSETAFQYSALGQSTGGTAVTTNTAAGQTGGSYYAEAMIPGDYFMNSDAVFTFAGQTVTLSSVPVVNGEPAGAEEPPAPTAQPSAEPSAAPTVEPTAEPTTAPTAAPTTAPTAKPTVEPTAAPGVEPTAAPGRSGIVIDGQFSDWDGIVKTETDEKYHPGVNEMALVWDGDKVYVYFMLMDNNYNALSWAGPNSNGKFVITTDLGNSMQFQVKYDGTVSGVDGAEWAVNSTAFGDTPHMWEMSFPADQLPPYLKTISLGFIGEPVIEDVADLQGSTGGPAEPIVYDGLYGDWTYYPHTVVGYDDAEQTRIGLYLDSPTLYGHVDTTLPWLLPRHGAEMNLTSIKINDDESKTIPLVFIAVDAEGNIDWNPDMDRPNTTVEYLMVHRDGWRTDKTLAEMESSGHNTVFGRAFVTAGASKDDMEFKIDMEKVAESLDMSPEDIHRISIHSDTLGSAWVEAGGVPTGAWLGVLLCLGTVGAVKVGQRRKKEEHT